MDNDLLICTLEEKLRIATDALFHIREYCTMSNEFEIANKALREIKLIDFRERT